MGPPVEVPGAVVGIANYKQVQDGTQACSDEDKAAWLTSAGWSIQRAPAEPACKSFSSRSESGTKVLAKRMLKYCTISLCANQLLKDIDFMALQ